jgi:hypothetical protein
MIYWLHSVGIPRLSALVNPHFTSQSLRNFGLAKFFTDHLAGERAASPRTIAAYRDAMKLLLT